MSFHSRIGSEFAGYRIESLLGRGGMSTVYLAEHIRVGKKVALKVLSVTSSDEEFQERFTREAKLAASIDHPNVITIDDAGDFNGELYIAMRYINGYDLGTLITPAQRVPIGRTLYILEQIASALDAAHRAGLVHRDVKPQNILIEAATDRAYLSDFGIVKSTLSSGLTRTGSFLGTPNYSAPEQIEGKPVDARTDVYALGCVAYACLVGSAPYEREGEVAVMNAHILDPPPNLNLVRPDLPHALGHVIEKAMAKAPDDRYDTCLAFVNDMRAGVMHRPIEQSSRETAEAPQSTIAAGRPAVGETMLSPGPAPGPPPLAGPSGADPARGRGHAPTGDPPAGAFSTPAQGPPRRRGSQREVRLSLGQLALLLAVLVIGAGGGAYLIFGRDNSSSNSNNDKGHVLGAPSNTGTPVVTSVVANGLIQSLRTSPGSWANRPTDYAFQWIRDGSPLDGATGATYAFQSGDVGHVFVAKVTATNTKGSLSVKSVPFTGYTPDESTLMAKLSAVRHAGKGSTCTIVPPTHPGVLAAATCLLNDPSHGVVYGHFHLDPPQVLTEDYMHNGEDELVKALGFSSIKQLKPGKCSGTNWLANGSWRHEESDPSSMVDGQRLCYQVQKQCPLAIKLRVPNLASLPSQCSIIAWTNADANLFAIGEVSSIPEHSRLYDWWHFWVHRVG